jgi:alanine-glyoxylate transaminase/serine-glyoxylate transaminase/serine-pyruvate transaminase
VYYPDGIKATDLLPKIVKAGVMVAGGLHPDMAAKYFRIGHMGITATEPERGYMTKTVDAIRDALVACGHKVSQ